MPSNDGFISITSMVQYLFIGEILIFSLCLIVIQIRTRAVYIWLLANVVALAGGLLTLSHFETNLTSTKVIGGAMILLAAALKSYSFSNGPLFSKRNQAPSIVLIFGFILAVTVIFTGKSDYLLMIASLSSIFISISAIMFLVRNRLWIGLPSRNYLTVIFCITTSPFFYLFYISYPIGSVKTFVLAEGREPTQVILQSILVFLTHICFLGMVIARNARENIFELRRSIRMREAGIQSRMREQESAALADERYHLLKMLTHEVRQPMNSAQAALQALSNKISSGSETPAYVQSTIGNTVSTLNSIILSISNSILGATLITKGRVQKLEVTDICCIVELALLDLDPIETQHFEQKFDQPVMFADADPIILRLGIRNLLENAVKYSPRNSKKFLNVEIDDEQLTLVISVTNDIEGSAMLGPDIFNQARRGVDKKYDGYGLGLYIAKEVARLHRGSLSCYNGNGKTVTFELTLPA